MKRAIRMLFLMVGLFCTYTALAAPACPRQRTVRQFHVAHGPELQLTQLCSFEPP